MEILIMTIIIENTIFSIILYSIYKTTNKIQYSTDFIEFITRKNNIDIYKKIK